MNIRKLTNSLFEDGVFMDQCNVIKEEEKERDEQDQDWADSARNCQFSKAVNPQAKLDHFDIHMFNLANICV